MAKGKSRTPLADASGPPQISYPCSMIDPTEAALLTVAEDIHRLTGAVMVWKDVDPGLRVALPHRCTRHRNAYCRAVQRDPQRLARCIQADDHTAPNLCADGQPHIHRCPFGVVEVAVPVSRQGLRLGTALLGPFAGRACVAGLEAAHAQLAPPPSPATMLALGRLTQAALRAALPLRTASTAPKDALMATALTWMDQHAHPQLRAEAAARSVGLSTSRFLHRFSAACGEGFRQRLTRILAGRATRWLADPRRTVLSIALDLGYGDEDAFTTAFKRIYHLPPGRFRAQLLAASG